MQYHKNRVKSISFPILHDFKINNEGYEFFVVWYCLALICTWVNGSVNNGEAGDLRRHRAHYHVIVKSWKYLSCPSSLSQSAIICAENRYSLRLLVTDQHLSRMPTGSHVKKRPFGNSNVKLEICYLHGQNNKTQCIYFASDSEKNSLYAWFYWPNIAFFTERD